MAAAAATACALAVGACGGDGAGGGAAATGDAGARTGAGSSGLRLDATPFLTIPADGGTEASTVGYVRDATRLPDGTVVVVDLYGVGVLFFDDEGRFLRRVGEEGDGPGELLGPRTVHRCAGDSLFVFDYNKRSVVVMDGEGAFGREFRPEGSPQELACGGGGWMAVMGFPERHPQPGEDGERPRAPLFVSDLEGSIVRELGTVPFADNRPVGRLTRIAATRSRLYVGTADSAGVDVYDRGGGRLAPLAVGRPGRVPTPEHVERWIERAVSVTSVPELRRRFTEQYREIEARPTTPPYVELRADPEGALWAVVSVPGDPTTVLQSVSADGEALGEVELPGEVEVFEVGRDYVLGVRTDELGRQEVVLYRLHRG